ncbi:MAG TPA: MbnP family protein [Saprospiraceae bacterium]|nr:MbnP family protein [Saprospiraceae bacterium]
MKILGCLLMLVIVIGIHGCKGDTDKEGSLTLHFKGTYNGQPLAMFSTKPFTTPQQLQFTHLSLYVSDLVLLDQANTVNLSDIELVDLSFDDENSADGGFAIRFDHLPPKEYSGISFGIGVPPDLNVKKPEDFPSSNPLSNPVNYWLTWNSFIFMKTEGRIDTIGNGTFGTGFAYHTGTDDLYRNMQRTIPLSIEEGKNKDLDITIDYQKVLDGIDIKINPQNHNPKDSIQIRMLVQNLDDALKLIQ